MTRKEKKFYMVREDILPAAIVKTAWAKEMLNNGEASNVLDAVDRLGMARSTFYKYKDGVFPFFNADNLEIINIILLLKHQAGVLSGVLNYIAGCRGNILTINQNLPLNGAAHVTVSLSIDEMNMAVDDLLLRLQDLDGVINVDIIGKS